MSKVWFCKLKVFMWILRCMLYVSIVVTYIFTVNEFSITKTNFTFSCKIKKSDISNSLCCRFHKNIIKHHTVSHVKFWNTLAEYESEVHLHGVRAILWCWKQCQVRMARPIVVRQLSIAFSRSERNNVLKVGELSFKVQCMIIIIILNLLCPMYTVCHK